MNKIHVLLILLCTLPFILIGQHTKVYEQTIDKNLKWIITIKSPISEYSACNFHYSEPFYTELSNPVIPICSENDTIRIELFKGKQKIKLIEGKDVFLTVEYPLSSERLVDNIPIKRGELCFLGKNMIEKIYYESTFNERLVNFQDIMWTQQLVSIPPKYHESIMKNFDQYIVFLYHKLPCE